jgi:WD40 repeat protein
VVTKYETAQCHNPGDHSLKFRKLQISWVFYVMKYIPCTYNNELLVCLAYDRYIKLWDTETGQCVSRFTSRKIPYCAKFHPEEDKQHFFVAGTSDKKIICVSHQNIHIIS